MGKVDEILAAQVAQGDDTKNKLQGAAFMIVNKEGILYEGSAGRIDLPTDSPAWTPDTFTPVASLTKLPSAICMLQLVERGLLALDEDLRPRLPFLASVQILRGFDDATDQPILEDNTRPVTLRMLLTHTSGLSYDMMGESLMKWRKATGKERLNLTWTEEGLATPLIFEPGTGWAYGTGIDWATMILEKVTGQRLSEYMDANIFEPLGMRDSGFWPERLAGREERAKRTAKAPVRGPDGSLVHDGQSSAAEEHPVDSGGAGLFTTARDYSKLLTAVLQGKLLREGSIELLFKPQLEGESQRSLTETLAGMQSVIAPEYPVGMPADFAFGGMLNMEDCPGKRAKRSVMWSGVMNSHWWIDRETGIAGVLVVTVLPYADPVVIKLYDELETAVYGDLLAKK